MNRPVHEWPLEELLKKFSAQDAIDEVVISCAEYDLGLSDPYVEELLAQLYKLC